MRKMNKITRIQEKNVTMRGLTPKIDPKEVEFLSNATALEKVKLPGDTGEDIKDAFTEGVADDIYNNILTQP